ncbi:unnamed protein product [Caenorhabditis angaria]|uniref:TIL domain-containing protein n=1 Tax=Caenorhabditis angaria TaxID=860376 RepID=A0A9P1IC76_9PELO|nr:unnamed protein product [Caenorhabditis angaria]
MKIFVFIIIFGLISTCFAELFHHHHNRSRRRNYIKNRLRNRSVIRIRNERNAEQCEEHEHHLICGPEKHCEKSCENMFSLPHCLNKLDHPKCYFPRCVCNSGFVRDYDGKCVKPSHCPNHYFEPSSMFQEEGNEMMIQFKPVKFVKTGIVTQIGGRHKKRTHVKLHKTAGDSNDILIDFEPVKLTKITGNIKKRANHFKPANIDVKF